METQGTLFDQRFFYKYAGKIVADPVTAIIELVANCWDAYATNVEIVWPSGDEAGVFSISDNGCGMSKAEFLKRWPTLDYDRLAHQGSTATPPKDIGSKKPRTVFGRNGKGRHAAFCFSNPYFVKTRQSGQETVWQVSRGISNPIKIELVEEVATSSGDGCEIYGTWDGGVMLMPDQEIRAIISTRFLTSPDFAVFVNGVRVTFNDVPEECVKEVRFEVGELGEVHILLVDSQRSDRTMKQHGIAWRVNGRLVGEPGWAGFENARLLDGRSEEARRYTIFVFADFLAPAVKDDWSGFDDQNTLWKYAYPEIAAKIEAIISEITSQKRQKTKQAIKEKHSSKLHRMDALSRERWNRFVDDVVEQCPAIGETQLEQLAAILANLEEAQSKYSLLKKLHSLQPNDFDNLNDLLRDWTINTAKSVLDEIQTRLSLIEEIRIRTKDEKADELHDLQPLFDRGLWIFGPEFEAVEFTSNRGMTTVIKKLLKQDGQGTTKRPDFVILPDSSLGFYSRPSFDEQHQEDGVDTVVIVDLKRPGVPIGGGELDQVWGYAKELKEKSYLAADTKIFGFVLGDRIAKGESEPLERGNTKIVPMLYDVFLKRAENRLLNLHKKVKEAPFMERFDSDEFLHSSASSQKELAV